MKLYAEFLKVEKMDDGTVRVQGVASSEAVDSQGEIVKADAMREALPDFMSLGTGALRSMHQPIAAGIVTKAEVHDDGKTYIEAEVVDPVEALKVEKGVYKGFSIGGRVTKREGKTIEKIKLGEISLVDRGANPEALLSLMKVDGVEDEPEPVAKGMYSVSQFAELLEALSYMTANSANEAAWEEDNSKVPAQLRAWLALGIEVFKEMAAEETAELLSALKPPEPAVVPDVVVLADPAGDLAKAGARHSAKDKEHLQAIHDHASAMGADCPGVDAGKADASGDLAKLDAEKAEALAKAETLEKSLADAKAEAETLAKRVKELEATPEPFKGATADLPGVVINKSQDNSDEAAKEEAIKKIQSMPEGPEKAQLLIKLAFNGVQIPKA